MLTRAHILVSGFVQGVNYRWFTEKKAIEYRLKGWVKNLWDGRVEIVCEGEKGLIIDFVRELRIGPTSADAKGVQIKWKKYTGEFDDFEIKF
ncbi:acylphosphatase [candidate division WOR-3 bacterium]|nr:acylphosphatase [candidate division WOR-3 bacterium]